ncbi:MAG TPA: DNA methylase, partial [Spirochaetota bacterium]|nr:DNA methylase [Spirochaetota bacterium]HPN29481.1 DNA methylase [bacterium]
ACVTFQLQSCGSFRLQFTVKSEIEKYYTMHDNNKEILGFLWARAIKCQNPNCFDEHGTITEIPLIRQYWLSKKKNKKIALFPYIKNKKLFFKIVGDGYEKMPKDFNPDLGTVSRAVATCPLCGSSISAQDTRKLFQDGKSIESLLVIVYNQNNKKMYRIASERDLEIYKSSEKYCYEKISKLLNTNGINPVPDEPLTRVPLTFGVINVWVYGLDKWGDLFNYRQKLSLVVFSEKIRKAYKEMIDKGYDLLYAKVIVTYLALALSRHSSYNASLCWWEPLGERSFNVFGRQAIPMVFDYSEQNPFGTLTGNWLSQIDITKDIISQLEPDMFKNKGTVVNSSATSLPFDNEYFDAIFTDPPYYDNVPYSYLSDFFYVWLKRIIGDLYPDLFSTPLTPKKNEIVAYTNGPSGWENGKEYFEKMLKDSFKEIYRLLKKNGIAIIVYAYKTTEGWESVINSLLDSRLVVTAAWPISTEMSTRLRANEAAALASSIYIIARKIETTQTGFYEEIKDCLKKNMHKKLDRLWAEGISGADFFIAAIGSAIEIFGKYEKVMDYEGNEIRAARLLEDVQKLATDYAVHQILHNGFSDEISDLTRFYVLYRWNYGVVKIHFDEARKLAASCSIDITQEWGRHSFIVKEKEFVKVLGPQDRNVKDLKDSEDLIDVLHSVLLLWEKGKRDQILEILQKTDFGSKEVFYRVAQAVSETLPTDNKEKKLLDGFLAGKERLIKEAQNQRLI